MCCLPLSYVFFAIILYTHAGRIYNTFKTRWTYRKVHGIFFFWGGEGGFQTAIINLGFVGEEEGEVSEKGRLIKDFLTIGNIMIEAGALFALRFLLLLFKDIHTRLQSERNSSYRYIWGGVFFFVVFWAEVCILHVLGVWTQLCFFWMVPWLVRTAVWS